MASFFDDEAEVGTTDDEDEMETEGTLKVRKFKVKKYKIFLESGPHVKSAFQHCNGLVHSFIISLNNIVLYFAD